MANRKIFTLNAWTVDSTGAWHQYNGTPKTFDSKNYNDDIDKAQKRAKGEFSDIVGDMSKIDNRKIQTVTLVDESGFNIVQPFTDGTLFEEEPVAEE